MTEVQQYDTHYEAQLDPEPEPTRAPIYVDAVVREDERRPIIPAQWHRGNIGNTVREHAGRNWHRTRYHAARSPKYLLLAAFWAIVGVFQIANEQRRWWWHAEQKADNGNVRNLRQEAANNGDYHTWRGANNDMKATRLFRGITLGVELVALLIAYVLLRSFAPLWVQVVVLLVILPPLAHFGHPKSMPIVRPAVVPPRFRLINSDIVLRAFYAAGLGHPDKPGQQITFGAPMARDGAGSQGLVDLPYGMTFADAMKAHGKIASGLDVALSQVFLERDPTSNRRVRMWIADRDPLAIPAGRTPLLRNAAKFVPTDIWQSAPFGLNERGELVRVPILWNSILVGAQPRQGKTFSARSLALYAAMDPYVKLTVFDASGKPDWRKFALVADRCGFGLAMTRDGDPVEALLEALREIKADVADRYQRLSELPVTVAPEGKLTRAIARDPRYRMPVRVVVLDEFQEYLVTGEKEANKEVAALLVHLVKVAPAAGVSFIDATQKPSGIGTGEVGTNFTAFRDNHVVRFSLRTGSSLVSDMVLGQGAGGEGYDSSELLPSYKGVGLLRGADDDTPTVRGFLADAEDAEKILMVARQLREAAGTLTGMAAGEDVAREVRDVLRDVRNVYYAGEAWVSWPQLAARLRDRFPEAYADETADSISARIRALQIEAKKGRDRFDGGRSVWGVPLAEVEKTLQRREIEAGR